MPLRALPLLEMLSIATLHAALLLASVLIACGLLLFLIAAVVAAVAILRPPRMTDARALVWLRRLTPADLGIEFADVHFDVVDHATGRKLPIAAWWMPHPASTGRCAILIHGYCDAKVGAIAWAPMLRDLGFSILAIDLRCHGETGGGYCTAGFYERHDLDQVINQLRAEQGERVQQLVLYGISLGAAVSAATAASRNDLAAVILECPYTTFRRAAAERARHLGLPGALFQNLVFAIAQKIARCDFDAVAPLQTVPKIPCPVLLIQSGDDCFVNETEAARIRAALEISPSPASMRRCWRIPQAEHVLALACNPDEYHRAIQNFLDAALPTLLSPSSSPCTPSSPSP